MEDWPEGLCQPRTRLRADAQTQDQSLGGGGSFRAGRQMLMGLAPTNLIQHDQTLFALCAVPPETHGPLAGQLSDPF
jgi:hypothetical protein